MTATVTVDGGVFVLPGRDTSADDLRMFVERLSGWEGLLDESWVSLLKSGEPSEQLAEDGLLPTWEELQAAFGRHGIVEYSVNDVSQLMFRILGAALPIEDHFGVQEILFDVEEVATDPDVLGCSAGESLRFGLARCLVLTGLLRSCTDGMGACDALALCDAPAGDVRLNARVYEVEHARDDLVTLQMPEDLESELQVCDDLPGFIGRMDECMLLRDAVDDNQIHAACRIALFKDRRARGDDIEWDDLVGWRIGVQFREKVHECCRNMPASFAGRLLRAVRETIDGENLAETRPLRTGAGGNNPQRTRRRDGATAWRRSIDNEYRLHYWRLEGGVTEFSWVAGHNDYYIPE